MDSPTTTRARQESQFSANEKVGVFYGPIFDTF
jgi:hypothetical protein